MMTKKTTDSELAKQSFTLLYEISRAIVSNRYIEEILLLVVSLTAEIMKSKICSLMLLDEEKQELVIKATQSLSEKYRTKPPIRVGESVIGRAVLEHRPITILNITKDPDYKYTDIARAEGLKSMVAVPMMIKDRVIGVLNCYTSEEREFTHEETQILCGVANQAALAIDNTRLLAEKVVAVETLETRKRVDQAKRILMKQKKINESEAYRVIQKKSMNNRRTLKEIADAIIVSDEI